MTELRNAVDSVRSTASTVTARVVELVTSLLVVFALTGWVLFWSNLVRLHYSQGDLASAMFTTVAFVGPAIAVLVWYVDRSLEIDIVPRDIDVNITSS